jgi:hypothetical protein
MVVGFMHIEHAYLVIDLSIWTVLMYLEHLQLDLVQSTICHTKLLMFTIL